MTSILQEKKRKYSSFKAYLAGEHGEQYSATDILIRYQTSEKEGLVVIKRANFPWGYASPGGMLDKNMPLQRNAFKEAGEEIGLEIMIDNHSFFRPYVLYVPGEDPRAEIISIAYTGTGIGRLKHGSDAKYAEVFTLDEIADMLFLPVGAHDKPEQKNVWAAKHHKVLYALYLLEQDDAQKQRKRDSLFTEAKRSNMENIVSSYYYEINDMLEEEQRIQQRIRTEGGQ